MQAKAYIRPATLAEALEALAAAEAPTLVAGGTDVLVDARKDERFRARTLIDIYGLEELRGVRDEGDALRIGALTTHAALAEDPLLRAHAGVLASACRAVGSLQIRSHATIGGNVANASPAADSLPALAVLRARVEIAGPGGIRSLLLDQVVIRPYGTCLEERELITHLVVPKLRPGHRCGLYKLGRRRALAIARMTVAAVLWMDGDRVEETRLAVGATFPRPMVFPDVDAMLAGKPPTEENIAAVARALSDKIPEQAGIRPSTRYKQPVCRNLTVRVLNGLLGAERSELPDG